jgi:threonine aldolase
MNAFPYDFSSDTQTRPSPAMRQAIANAEVGDEQKREDPSVNRLQEMVADLTGKDAALFLPTGTMCNLIAHAIHCRPGDEMIIDSLSHPVHFEGGGPAVHSRVSIRAIETQAGVFTPAQVEGAIRPDDPHFPRTRLVCVENTHNLHGGRIWPLDAIKAVAQCARKHGLAMHLDGARLMNAVVASGVSAKEICGHFDSCWIDLSKGLGCPAGGVLAGTKDFIALAWRYKHLFGGAMRQAGILAAAGVYAFENNVKRLAEDHAKAKGLAEGMAQIKGIAVDVASVETNIVVFDIGGTGVDRATFLKKLEPHGVRFSGLMQPTRLRAVTHLDIPGDGVENAIEAARKAVC